jgi:hypothetical protein
MDQPNQIRSRGRPFGSGPRDEWAILEVDRLRATDPTIRLMTAVKEVVKEANCKIHGRTCTSNTHRGVYGKCKEYEEYGRYGLTNHRLDRNGRSERQRNEQYDPVRHEHLPIGTEKRVMVNSAEWAHAIRNGWHPVRQWPDTTWTIRRDLCGVLTPEELETENAAWIGEMAQLLPNIRLDDVVQDEDDGQASPFPR